LGEGAAGCPTLPFSLFPSLSLQLAGEPHSVTKAELSLSIFAYLDHSQQVSQKKAFGFFSCDKCSSIKNKWKSKKHVNCCKF
jgi:hypothetical protein